MTGAKLTVLLLLTLLTTRTAAIESLMLVAWVLGLAALGCLITFQVGLVLRHRGCGWVTPYVVFLMLVLATDGAAAEGFGWWRRSSSRAAS